MGMSSSGSLAESPDAGEDFVGSLRPREGLGLVVVRIDVLIDRLLQFPDTSMRPALDGSLREKPEPALDLVEP